MMMDKIKVNGADQAEVYKFLKISSGDAGNISW
jgi:glutathione peroxidase-family protein